MAVRLALHGLAADVKIDVRQLLWMIHLNYNTDSHGCDEARYYVSIV